MKRKILMVLFILAAVALIGFSAWQIISILRERYISREEYDRARESYVSAIQPKEEQEEEPTETDPFPDLEIDMEGLLAENPDFVAWLYYEDAEISYPVVQESADEVNKYLKTTFEGTENSAGCVFMPYDADEAFRYMNTFIYGHNMKDGSMFGQLKNVFRKPDEAKNPYFYIWTKDGEAIRYRVIAAYVVEHDSEMYSIPLTDDAYQQYLSAVLELGSMDGYVPFTEEEETAMEESSPIVTLSTCYGSAGTSKRLLIQGVEIERRTVA